MASAKSIRLPKYRKQKRKGKNLAFIELNGHRHYLGTYGSDESKQRYERSLAEWLENGKRLSVDPSEITVVEITARFWEYAQRHYRRTDTTLTCEPNNIRQALRPLKELYGYTLAKEFGPLALKAVRQKMIEKGWCRSNINKMINRIKLMFKWAVENELVNPGVYHGLQAVSGLKYGRSKAKEKEPVKPAPDILIKGALDQMTPTVHAMVELQMLTGMRPGEVCIMRRRDIDMSRKIWIYTPQQHKTKHHGHERKIYLGPKAQSVLMPFLQPCLDVYLFNPRRSEKERRQKLHAQRKTALKYGNHPGTNRKKYPKRLPGDRYDTTSYGKAIKYACKLAFPVPQEIGNDPKILKKWYQDHNWSPNQLRHNYATSVRCEFGLDITQLLLGHTRADITEIYAEVDKSRALEVVARIG